MRAFVSRCNVYITRADDIDNVADSTWANPFVVEKIYANLSPLDRKLLKNSMGKSDDVQKLCEKADELLSMSEEVVASFETNNGWIGVSNHDAPNNHPQPRQRWDKIPQGWDVQENAFGYRPFHTFRPGGGFQGSNREEKPRRFRPGGGNVGKSAFSDCGPAQSRKTGDTAPVEIKRSSTEKVTEDTVTCTPLNKRNYFDEDKWEGNMYLPKYENSCYEETADMPSRAYLVGYSNSIRVPLCLDTGAGKSLMSFEMWRKINAKDQLELKPPYRGFQAVNGSTLNCRGSAIIRLMLMGETKNYVGYFKFFVVESLSVDALLGLDEIYRHGIRINMVDGFTWQDNIGLLKSNLIYKGAFENGAVLTGPHTSPDPGEQDK